MGVWEGRWWVRGKGRGWEVGLLGFWVVREKIQFVGCLLIVSHPEPFG